MVRQTARKYRIASPLGRGGCPAAAPLA